MRFWTTLQNLKQAVFVDNKKIVCSIPAHPPKTIYHRSGVVCEYYDCLALAKHASFELWNRAGTQCYKSFYHKMILAPHDLIQYGKDILICSSGLDLFFLMDLDGNVKWSWWGYENGLGGKNEYYFRDDWTIRQTTSDTCEPPVEEQAHFNSIWFDGNGSFLTASLKKKKIIQIEIGKQGYKLVTSVEESGCHSPFIHHGKLIYGTERGIKINNRKILDSYKWVKTIRPFNSGFAFTHEAGVCFTDSNWAIIEEIPLPSPYKVIYGEI